MRSCLGVSKRCEVADGLSARRECCIAAQDQLSWVMTSNTFGGMGCTLRRMRPVWMRFLPAVLVGLAVCGCTENAPPIARELPGSLARARELFDQRVKARFPVGPAESQMIAELRRERFEVHEPSDSSGRSKAIRDIQGLPCRRKWTISWTATAGQITDAAGDYGEVCL